MTNTSLSVLDIPNLFINEGNLVLNKARTTTKKISKLIYHPN